MNLQEAKIITFSDPNNLQNQAIEENPVSSLAEALPQTPEQIKTPPGGDCNCDC